MTPEQLVDILDGLQITTKDAAKEIGCSEVTLQQVIAGRRYPSHGGGLIPVVPRYIELGVRDLWQRCQP